MKEYYKIGEILLAFRLEYLECKKYLEELNNLIAINSKYKRSYFSGLLEDDKRLSLFIERNKLNLLKNFRNNTYVYSKYSRLAEFNILLDDNNYNLKYKEPSFYKSGYEYIPNIEIIDNYEFNKLIEFIYSLDIMNLNKLYYKNDHVEFKINSIDNANIFTRLGEGTWKHELAECIKWNGRVDKLYYEFLSDNNFRFYYGEFIEKCLSFEIESKYLPPEWISLVEKHKDKIDNVIFNVDSKIYFYEGLLNFSNIEHNNGNNIVKLRKK